MASKQKNKASEKRPAACKAAVAAVTPPASSPQARAAKCPPPDELDPSVPQLKHLGGSKSDDWNLLLSNQVSQAAWYWRRATEDQRHAQYTAQFAFLAGVNPQDVIEGMMAAQLFASHAAAMECYRRAMLPDQSTEGRQINLTLAAKLTRANAAQVDALAKHRNRGQQKVIVEHVHVYQGGQAIVGSNVTPGGVGKIGEGQPHAITHAAGAPMRCQDTQGFSLPVGSDAKRALPDARRAVTGRA